MTDSLEHTYDVVIVGTGAAGLSTGMGAQDEGLSVLLLESTGHWAATPRCPGAACGCRTTR